MKPQLGEPYMDRFTAIELAQLIVTSLGLLASIISMRDAMALHRWMVLKQIGNGRRLVSTGHLVGEALRGGWQAILLCAAVISLVELPSPPAEMPEVLLDWLVIRKFTFLVGSIFCATLTLWDLYIRKALGHLSDL
jgi:hypothetical protein